MVDDVFVLGLNAKIGVVVVVLGVVVVDDVVVLVDELAERNTCSFVRVVDTVNGRR